MGIKGGNMRGSYYKDKSKYATVSGIDVLNVREVPNGKIITTIPEGTNVKVIGKVDAIWTRIDAMGVEGVVVSKYLKEGIL
jgi:uncharacterized protein YgiM (DUF1202 family)